MATERQIAANRLNAARSTGPKTDQGKTRSRANATVHGLVGESGLVEDESSAAFEARRAAWGAEYRPSGEAAGWALDRAVAASLRIERCERAVDEVASLARQRAALAWDQDRGVEAAGVFARLGREPVLASRQLQATRAGAELMVEAWTGLVAKIETGEDWSEAEAARALDLLGVDAGLRSGRTLIDAGAGDDPVAFRRSLAFGEIDRLEGLVEEALGPLDEVERRAAMGGASGLLSKEARLVLRYERDAWRRYRESIRQVKDSNLSAGELAPPSPAGSGRPEVGGRALALVPAPVEGPRRGPIAGSSPIRRDAIDGADRIGMVDAGPEGWAGPGSLGVLVDPRSGQPLVTERTRFGGEV